MITTGMSNYDRVLAKAKAKGRNAHDLQDYYITQVALWTRKESTSLEEVATFLRAPKLRLMDARDYFNQLSPEDLAQAEATLGV